jgi:hypothetical protein
VSEPNTLGMAVPRARGKTSLAIVERAFRGTIEEQYGHIVWLSRIVRKMGGNTSLLLKGDAVLFAVSGQPRESLQIGNLIIGDLPHYESTLRAMREEGVPLFAFRPDLDRLGLDEGRLVTGVVPVGLQEWAGMCGGFDAIWYW